MRTTVRSRTRIYRRHEGGQVPTCPTTILEIMSAPHFALGVADARAGRPYRDGYQTWHTNAQWNYERGRQWAIIAPADMPVKVKGRVNDKAVRVFVYGRSYEEHE